LIEAIPVHLYGGKEFWIRIVSSPSFNS
jgi:hypothetical protein